MFIRSCTLQGILYLCIFTDTTLSWAYFSIQFLCCAMFHSCEIALYNFSTTVCFITPILFLFCRFPLLHGGPPQNVLLHLTLSPGSPPKTRIFRNFSRRFPFQNLVFSPKNPHFFAKKVVLHRYTIHTCHRC